MSINAVTIAKEFSLSEAELTRKSLRAFLLEQLRFIEAERKTRCAKFGVSDLWAMEQLMVEGKVEEEAILENLQRVDYLTARCKRIKAMIEEL